MQQLRRIIDVKVLTSRELHKEVLELVKQTSNELKDHQFIFQILVENSKIFLEKRRFNKIINTYAVTKLPFVLISEDDKDIAAVYSEEMPITVERILEKLNDTIN